MNCLLKKCLWAFKNSLKGTSVSIKKFYQCMSDYASKEQSKGVCDFINEKMNEFLEQMEAYDNGT